MDAELAVEVDLEDVEHREVPVLVHALCARGPVRHDAMPQHQGGARFMFALVGGHV